MKDPSANIDIQMQTAQQKQFEENKKVLESIVRCILFCGKQGIPLRGHDDLVREKNRGNFKELLEFRAENDQVLQEFLRTCPANASYTSGKIQNELIDLIGEEIRRKIIQNIGRPSPFFSIIADEVTDKFSNQEIMGLCVRYLSEEDGEIRIEEKFVDFCYVERTTAASLQEAVYRSLQDCKLERKNIRGQAYDTTNSMSSSGNGLQGRIQKDIPAAIYSPCNAHKLNLVIASASKVPAIKNCLTMINEATLFFNSSPKRQRHLEQVVQIMTDGSKRQKLIGLCKTRWCERFEGIENFIELAECVTTACEIIAFPHLFHDEDEFQSLFEEPKNWDRETHARAQGIVAAVRSFENIAALLALRNILLPLRGITTKLQKRDLDIYSALTSIADVQSQLTDLRTTLDEVFKLWYQDVLNLAKKVGGEERLNRRTNSQKHRNNVPADSPEEFIKRAIFIPFLDGVITEMRERFSPDTRSRLQSLFSLLPEVLKKIEYSDLPQVLEGLKIYQDDLPHFESLGVELELWKRKWQKETVFPQSLVATLKDCDSDTFPNISTLLSISCILPATSCDVERSFSALRRIKTVLRSTMGESRLTALALMSIHRNVQVNPEEIVQAFIQKQPRRLFSNIYEKN